MAIGIVYKFHEKKDDPYQSAFLNALKALGFSSLQPGFAVSKSRQDFEAVYDHLSQYIKVDDSLIAFEILGKMKHKGLPSPLSDWTVFLADQGTQES